MNPDDVIEDLAAKFNHYARAGVNPFVHQWGSFEIGEPINFLNGRRMQGFNALAANIAMVENTHFQTNQWATAGQVKRAGGIVWDNKPTPILTMDKGQYGVTDLYNLSQLSNLDLFMIYAPRSDFSNFVEGTGATLENGRPGYYLSIDIIKTKPDLHEGARLCHSLIHWTGHKSRLNRFQSRCQLTDAFEEMIADMGSSILCQRFSFDGIDPHEGEHLTAWADIVHDDPNALLILGRKTKTALTYLEKPDVFARSIDR